MNLKVISNNNGELLISSLTIKKILISYIKSFKKIAIDKKYIKINIFNNYWTIYITLKLSHSQNLQNIYKDLQNYIINNLKESSLPLPRNIHFIFSN